MGSRWALIRNGPMRVWRTRLTQVGAIPAEGWTSMCMHIPAEGWASMHMCIPAEGWTPLDMYIPAEG